MRPLRPLGLPGLLAAAATLPVVLHLALPRPGLAPPAPLHPAAQQRMGVLADVHADALLDIDNRGIVQGNRRRWSPVLAWLGALGGPGAGSAYAAHAASWAPADADADDAATIRPANTSWLNVNHRLAAASDDGRWRVLQHGDRRHGALLLHGDTLVRHERVAEVEDLPLDVNNQGWMVGAGRLGSGDTRPLLWRHGSGRPLPLAGHTGGRAVAINNHGVVLGEVWSPPHGRARPRAARWVEGRLDWVMSAALAPHSGAVALDDEGRMLVTLGPGNAWNATAAVVGQDGRLTPLSPGRAQVAVRDMNAAGTVVGSVEDRAVLWIRGVETDLGAYLAARGLALPPAWGRSSIAGINDGGAMVVQHGTAPAQPFDGAVVIPAGR